MPWVAPNNANVERPTIFAPSVSHWPALVNYQTGREIFDLGECKATALTPVVMAILGEPFGGVGKTEWRQTSRLGRFAGRDECAERLGIGGHRWSQDGLLWPYQPLCQLDGVIHVDRRILRQWSLARTTDAISAGLRWTLSKTRRCKRASAILKR